MRRLSSEPSPMLTTCRGDLLESPGTKGHGKPKRPRLPATSGGEVISLCRGPGASRGAVPVCWNGAARVHVCRGPVPGPNPAT